MSFANSLKKISSEFNVGLRILKRNMGLKSTWNRATLDALKPSSISILTEPLSFSICKRKTEESSITFPQANITIKKTIIEPVESIKINFELPIRSSKDNVLELPYYIEKEIKEPPTGRVISKRATSLLIIRRRKMKKHKYKKHLKKFRVLIANKKLMRKAKKESDFQLSLKNILSEAETYSPEEYVSNTLKTVNWERPVTRVKGFLAPKWVVNQYLEERKEKKIIKERIEECSKKEQRDADSDFV